MCGNKYSKQGCLIKIQAGTSKPDGLAEISAWLMKENSIISLREEKNNNTSLLVDHILKSKNTGDNYENVP